MNFVTGLVIIIIGELPGEFCYWACHHYHRQVNFQVNFVTGFVIIIVDRWTSRRILLLGLWDRITLHHHTPSVYHSIKHPFCCPPPLSQASCSSCQSQHTQLTDLCLTENLQLICISLKSYSCQSQHTQLTDLCLSENLQLSVPAYPANRSVSHWKPTAVSPSIPS